MAGRTGGTQYNMEPPRQLLRRPVRQGTAGGVSHRSCNHRHTSE